MSDPDIAVEQFRALVLDRLSFLEDKGFRHIPRLEETTPTGASVVFLGKYVAFVFSLDIRDQCVDGEVVKVQDGQMKSHWEGGYSANIFGHLIEHEGYRGSPNGSIRGEPKEMGKTPIETMIIGWAGLLKRAGQKLLSDQPDSLPARSHLR